MSGKDFKGQILSQYILGDCVDLYQLKIRLYMSLNFQICLAPEVCAHMCVSQSDLFFHISLLFGGSRSQKTLTTSKRSHRCILSYLLIFVKLKKNAKNQRSIDINRAAD